MERPLRSRSFAGILALGLTTLLGREARAQEVPVGPERIPAFGRSVAGTDDSTATVTNPANLGFMPGSEFRWQGVYLDEGLRVPYQGHALTGAIRFPFNLVTALRLDLLYPPQSSLGGFSANYHWLTWALALQASESLSFGFSLQHAYSGGIVANGIGSYSLAVSARPASFLGFSIVGSDLSSPLSGDSAQALAALGAPNVALGRSFTAAFALRPMGTRAFELGLEARYFSEPAIWEPRATLGVDLPYVGRLRGEFAVVDPGANQLEWRATAGLSLYVNSADGSTELEGGAVTGTALGRSGSWNFYNDVAFTGYREPVGLAPPRVAVKIRLESTPGTREHVALLRRLWALSEDPDVAAVVFEPRTSPTDSLAHAQELRDAIRLLQVRGKKTLCHLEDASGAALYVCAATDRILLNPAGGLRFAGLKTRHLYFAKLLEKLGIQADFVRIGAHKSAPERFTRESASDVAREDTVDLLQQIERWFSGDVAHDRKMSVETLRERIARGPFVASEAKDAGLVDGFAFDDQVEKAASDLVGERVTLADPDRAPAAPERFGNQRSIALLYVDGDIVDGRSKNIPFLGMDIVGSYTIAETLQRIRKNPLIAAVVLRIESPGGSSMASDVMWREIALTARERPVIVSMGDVAASGGYYVAAPGTRIFANPLTITGSIGVFYGKADVSGLMKKIGVGVEVYKTAPRADAESLFRPFSEEERQELVHKVGQFYDVFLSRVADGRHMSKEAVDRIGQGRVWTGEQAKENGLVDELGGLRQALAYARRVAHLGEEAPIVELPKIPTSLLGQLLGIEGIHDEAAIAKVLPPAVTDLAHAMAPFLVHPSDKPLSRLEITRVVLP
ncbi:MAG TPA: signal peptide peptidase SppA [Polyangiaceae bacterium]|nr:signal peptide peptidase SppA [Polyangiaceae bacterium]